MKRWSECDERTKTSRSSASISRWMPMPAWSKTPISAVSASRTYERASSSSSSPRILKSSRTSSVSDRQPPCSAAPHRHDVSTRRTQAPHMDRHIPRELDTGHETTGLGPVFFFKVGVGPRRSARASRKQHVRTAVDERGLALRELRDGAEGQPAHGGGEPAGGAARLGGRAGHTLGDDLEQRRVQRLGDGAVHTPRAHAPPARVCFSPRRPPATPLLPI
jgi:hypothetical protein